MSLRLTTSGFQERPPETVDIGLFMRTLKRRARTIAVCTALATAAAIIHVMFATPQFTAAGTLYLGDTQTNQENGNAGAGNLNLTAYSTQSDVETQIELLSTGVLVQRAVLKTGLNADIRPSGKPKLTYWRWRLFGGGSIDYFAPDTQSLQVVDATTPGKFEVVTGNNNDYKLFYRGGLFKSNRMVLTGHIGQPATGNGVSLTVQPSGQDEQSGTGVTIAPGQHFDLDVVSPDALTAGLLGGAYDVVAGGLADSPTKLAFLKFRWSNPYQAQSFVNQLMADYIATQLAWKTESASVTGNFVGDQLSQVSDKLAKADQALADYQAQTGIVDPQQSVQAAVNRMTQLETQEAAVKLQQEAFQQLDASLNARNGHVNPFLVSQANDTVLASMTTSLSDAEVKLRQLQMEYTANSQDLMVQQAQVAQLRSAITSTVHNDLAAANESLADLDAQIAQYRNQIKTQPSEALKVSSLSRSSKLLGQLYELLTEKAEQAQISKAATIIDTRVVTPASLPLGATSPKALITIIAGAFGGFAIGIAIVLAQRSFSGRFESEEQIRIAVPLPVYGTVPKQNQPLMVGAMFGPDGLNAFSESFKLIRHNIYRHSAPDRGTAILVISASKEDGKTTVATNIAKTLADDGKSAILVDCDLYLSRLEGLSDFSGTPGLTDWLATGQRPLIKAWPDERFSVLSAGTIRRPRGESLDETALGLVIQVLGREFDYIILDSPPLPIVSDGVILGGFADLILSVVSVAHTGRRAFTLHNQIIEELGRPHGIIINNADDSDFHESDAYFHQNVSRKNKFTGWFNVS
jgi:tyrosine-protein kinase Etk/Wzc